MRGYGRGRGAADDGADQVEYDGRFAFMRLRYGRRLGRILRREPPGRTTFRAPIFTS